jgi:hypothetical protein
LSNTIVSRGSHSSVPPTSNAHPLLRPGTGRAVPLRRPGRRQERGRAFRDRCGDPQLIAARDAARRMHDDRMADALALGIQRLLHDERPVVTSPGEDRLACATLETQIEFRAPRSGHRLGDTHGQSYSIA